MSLSRILEMSCLHERSFREINVPTCALLSHEYNYPTYALCEVPISGSAIDPEALQSFSMS